MRLPVRLLKPLEAPSLRSSKNALYVCSNCRYDASLLPSQHNHQSRRYASGSGSTPFTEKLRRRIWGTDNPPGLEDPYGGEGVIASEWAKRKAQYMGKRELQQKEEGEEESPEEEYEYEEGEDLIPEDFNPATTAHDLPRMGHLSQWTDFPPTEGDIYQPFVSREKASESAQFRSAAQSVVIELSLLHELKKPLLLACDIPRHDEMIWEMIKECQISNGSLKFPNKETRKTLFFVFNQLGETPEAQTEAAAEATEQPEAEAEAVAEEQFEAPESGIVDTVYSYALKAENPPAHEGYFHFSLADPAVKFAFFKRYSQITGHHMQDICAYKAQTVGDVIAHVEKVCRRPKKLAQELRTLNIPNVAVYSKRYTKGRQDRENGRAKLVEAALRERGLLRNEQEDKSSKFRL